MFLSIYGKKWKSRKRGSGQNGAPGKSFHNARSGAAPDGARERLGKVAEKIPAAGYLENHPLSRIDTLSRSQTMI